MDLVEQSQSAVAAEMRRQGLLNDVGPDLHDEVVRAVTYAAVGGVAANLGDGELWRELMAPKEGLRTGAEALRRTARGAAEDWLEMRA